MEKQLYNILTYKKNQIVNKFLLFLYSVRASFLQLNCFLLYLHTVLESLPFQGSNLLCYFFGCESVLDNKIHSRDCQ